MSIIPVFQDINELHHAALTAQESMLTDFHIYRNEEADETCRPQMPPHRNNFFQISFDVQSNYQLHVNSSTIHTESNKIYFGGLGKLISWESSGQRKWKGFSLMFKPDFLNLGINNRSFLAEFPFFRFDSNISLNFPVKDQAILIDLCEKIHCEQNNGPFPNAAIIKHYLYIILLHLKRLHGSQHAVFQNHKSSRDVELVGNFEGLVNAQFPKLKSVGYYAGRLFVTSKHLSEVTKHITGKTAKEVIMERVFLEAKSLLKQTNLSLTQIASELLFNDTSNFIKFFKKYAGESPSTYRSKP